MMKIEGIKLIGFGESNTDGFVKSLFVPPRLDYSAI
jgi:hypothetical protein